MMDAAQARRHYEQALEVWRAANDARLAGRRTGRRGHEHLQPWTGFASVAASHRQRAAELDLDEDAAYEAFIRARDEYVRVVRAETA